MSEESRERILLYGGTGSGKSYAWLTLTKYYKDSKFYCIDTDEAIARMKRYEFKDSNNIELYTSRDWKTCKSSLFTIQQVIKSNDWLIIDMLDTCWDYVQSYFVEEVFNKRIDDYFIEARKSAAPGTKKLEALKGWVDWVVINKIYQDFINSVMYNMQCNVLVTAKASKLETTDESDTQDIFSIVGFKPDGEKRNAYRVHTVLYLNHTFDGYHITTIKDRGRKVFDNELLKNFAEQYTKLIEESK